MEQYVIAILNCFDKICGYVREDHNQLVCFHSTIAASKEINEIYFDLLNSEIDLPDFCYVIQPLNEVVNQQEGL